MDKRTRVLVAMAIATFGFLLLVLAGVRVTFQPEMPIDWGTTSGIATCIATIIAVFALFLTGEGGEKPSSRKEIEEVREKELREKVLLCIGDGITVTTKRIRKQCGLSRSKVREVLKKLEDEGRVKVVGQFDRDDENCTWMITDGGE